MISLHFCNHFKCVSNFPEPFFLRDLGETRVERAPLEFFSFSCCLQVLSRCTYHSSWICSFYLCSSTL